MFPPKPPPPNADSQQRVRWLRLSISDYVTDLAARVYFRLPFTIAGEWKDPQIEAFELAVRLGHRGNLTTDEIMFAFNTAWSQGLQLAQRTERVFELAAARHVQLYRRRDDLAAMLIRERARLPKAAPFLSDEDIAQIAQRFQHRPGVPAL